MLLIILRLSLMYLVVYTKPVKSKHYIGNQREILRHYKYIQLHGSNLMELHALNRQNYTICILVWSISPTVLPIYQVFLTMESRRVSPCSPLLPCLPVSKTTLQSDCTLPKYIPNLLFFHVDSITLFLPYMPSCNSENHSV